MARVLLSFLVTLLMGAYADPVGLGNLCAKYSSIQVETMVFSGTPNPFFTLSGSEWQHFCALLPQANRTLTLPTCRLVGFTGWKLCSSKDAHACVLIRGEKTLDDALFASLSLHIPSTPTPAMDHIMGEMQRLHSSNGGDMWCAEDEPAPSVPESNCGNVPIKGPDDPTQVHYDPSNDDQGCFVKKQGENNCYDYGNDIVTNSFAQPGRGSGVCPPNKRPCVKNDCDSLKRAAISDGLIWVGADLPSTLPKDGHYVSLHVWPKSNFHWIRMDADMYWSHKPGGSPVRNVDNNKQKIKDPSKADFSPWTEHCGYMLAVPSKAVIKEEFAHSFINV
jgi:hypothetical protein